MKHGFLVVLIILGVSVVVSQNSIKEGQLTVVPYAGTDWSTMPLDVQSVTTEMGRAVTGAVVGNRGDRTVTGAKLRWTVSGTAYQGETRLLSLNIAPGTAARISYPIVGIDDVLKTIPEKRVAELRIEIVVSEIEYDNGRIWRFGDPGIRWDADSESVGCANQTCLWNADAGTYICSGPSDGTFCAVGSQGNSCTVTRCQRGFEIPES